MMRDTKDDAEALLAEMNNPDNQPAIYKHLLCGCGGKAVYEFSVIRRDDGGYDSCQTIRCLYCYLRMDIKRHGLAGSQVRIGCVFTRWAKAFGKVRKHTLENFLPDGSVRSNTTNDAELPG